MNIGLDEKTGNRRTQKPGVVLALCTCLSVCAFAARRPDILGGLLAADLAVALVLCGPGFPYWKAAKVFVAQSTLIVVLYLFRFGTDQGVVPGLTTSGRLFLAYLPGLIAMESVSETALVRSLSRLISDRAAFVLSAVLKFGPAMVKEMRSIYETQIYRGARIAPKDLIRPWNWPDLVDCLAIPWVVRAMALSHDLSQAAAARNFESAKKRTCWPEN